MPPDEILLWAITVAAFLATALVVFVLIHAVLGRKQPSSTGSGMISMVSGSGQAEKKLERRRSERLVLRVPVLAYGHAPGKKPFHEEVTTLEVSSHGGLLTFAAKVWVGQKLLLMNITNQEEQECHVVRLGLKRRKKRDVAIEFTRPAPDFWQTNTQRPQAASS